MFLLLIPLSIIFRGVSKRCSWREIKKARTILERGKEPRRHKNLKARYRVSNWREYGQALQQRGRVIVRVTPEVLEAWAPARAGHHGRASAYSDIATKTAVMLRPFSRCSTWICRFQTKQPRSGPALGCR